MDEALDSSLLRAVHERDTKVVRDLLKRGVPKVILDRGLVAASGGEDVSIVKLLLSAGANPEKLQSIGTLMMGAAMNGQKAIVQALVAGGADPHRQVRKESALSAALSENQIAVIRYLDGLKARIDPSTELRYAAQHGNLTRAKSALARGADVNALRGGVLRETPLTAAASYGRAAMVNLLLEAGANPNRRVEAASPLYDAVAHGRSLPVVRALIAAGARVDTDRYGETPLMIAASLGELEIAQCLLAHGANPHARDPHRGMTVADHAKRGKNAKLRAMLSELDTKAERDAPRSVARALARTYGGSPREYTAGFLLDTTIADHNAQLHIGSEGGNLGLYGVRFHRSELNSYTTRIAFGFAKPDSRVLPGATLAGSLDRPKGMKLYASNLEKPNRPRLGNLSRHLAPHLPALGLKRGEFLELGGRSLGLVWQGADSDRIVALFRKVEQLLDSISRPALPARQLFDCEWRIKPASKSSATAPHLFGGVRSNTPECPGCRQAENAILRLDLGDPFLPATKLGRRPVSITHCLECGEWSPRFHDLHFRPVQDAASPQADDLPARPMVLEPVPKDRKAGRISKVGGKPAWIQSDDTPDCPQCEKPMAFLLQMSSDSRISYADMGILYAFACPECRTLASLVQSY